MANEVFKSKGAFFNHLAIISSSSDPKKHTCGISKYT